MTRALGIAAVVAMLAGSAFLGRSAASRPSDGGWPLPDFALRDDQGRVTRLADLAGRPWVAAFIYASCGTQCPMMTAKMKALRARLPEARLVTFSVDSADTPERLAAYKKATGANWMFLTGHNNEVPELCKTGFKLPLAQNVDPKDPILHSDRLVLVDGKGRVRGFFNPGEEASLLGLVSALRSL